VNLAPENLVDAVSSIEDRLHIDSTLYLDPRTVEGDLARALNIAFPAIAPSKIQPPASVCDVAVSPRNNQTQTGAKSTSASDNRVSSTAGSDLEPSV